MYANIHFQTENKYCHRESIPLFHMVVRHHHLQTLPIHRKNLSIPSYCKVHLANH